MKLKFIAPALLILLTVSACAAGTDQSQTAAHGGALYQLVVGLWHGLIAPFTLIGEIINTIAPRTLPWTFRMYEVDNGGALYIWVSSLVCLAVRPSCGQDRAAASSHGKKNA